MHSQAVLARRKRAEHGPGVAGVAGVAGDAPRGGRVRDGSETVDGRGAVEAREAERLALLKYLDAVRAEADSVLQGIVDDARSAFGTDLALINLVLPEEQYFRAWSGELPAEYAESRRLPREHSVCSRVVEAGEPLVVEDFLEDEGLRDHLFSVNYGTRFYAGVPLVASNGTAIGTVCLAGGRPMRFGGRDLALLEAFARAAVGRLETLGALARERRQGQLHETLLKAQSEIGEGLVLTRGERIVHANEAFCRIVGHDLDELRAMPSFFALVPPEERDEVGERLAERLRGRPDGGRPEDRAETIVLGKDGRRVPVEIGVKVLRSEGDVELVVVVRDVTARKESEERLRFQARLLDAVGQAVMAVDLSGEIVYWNRAAEKLYGWSAEEALGMDLLEAVVPEESRGRGGEIVARLIEGESWSGEAVVRRRDGTTFPAFVSDTPVFDESGEIVGVIGVSHDVTERRLAEEALRASEAELRALFEAMTDVIVVLDAQGRYLEVAPTDPSLLYEPPEDLLGKTLHQVLPEAQADLFLGCVWRALETRRAVPVEYGMEIGGKEAWFEATVSPMLEDSVVWVARDVTERRRSEGELRRSEERYRAVVERTADGVVLIDPDTKRIIEANAALLRMLGYAPEEMAGLTLYDVIEDDSANVDRNHARVLGGESFVVGERRYLRKDGSAVEVEASATLIPYDDGVVSCCIVRDITERKALEERLRHRAYHDGLTGLANRALLMERIDLALARAERSGGEVAVLFLDLDDFKVVNDSLGHDAGDRLLVKVADRLGRCLRPEDMVARLGGDEFAVLLEEVDGEAGAAQIAQRISEALREPFSLGAHEAHVTASVGVALALPGDCGAEDLLRHADIAMYQAKVGGKARHRLFEPAMNERAARRLAAENELRRAIARGELVAHYQPKFSVKGGEIVGMEALVRWADPERGLVPPAEFVPLAEETGLVVPMGEWVMREACRQAAEWRDERPGAEPVAVWVNLSPRQFHRADVVGQVSAVLEETGLDPRCLGLEITEGVVMDDAESTIGTLGRLKSLGVRLAIDDFGKGYSSLGYVKRFPVDCLKIDRSFVGGICEHPEDLAIAQAVITLGRALGMKVVAEGVETAEQLVLLQGLGCDHAQGYHLAMPMPAEEASAFLAEHGYPRR